MSEERFYQPDFSCIFGKKFANAFLYKKIDSLIWPIFTDVKKSEQLKKLIALKDSNNRPYFYHRKISLEDEMIELHCANIKLGLVQGMNLGRDYGISNEDVLSVVQNKADLFKAILSYDLSQFTTLHPILNEIEEISEKIDVVGIVVYPSYIQLDLSQENNEIIREFFDYCADNEYFIKIDLGNFNLPNYHNGFITPQILKSVLSKFPNNVFIVSGLDLSNDFYSYLSLMKYANNLWIEIDPRTFGGTTPTEFFDNLFRYDGFIQNCWDTLTIGSATPTLEISQMIRGFNESTEKLKFSHRNLLRTWSFRNLNRLNPGKFKSINDKSQELYQIKRDVKVEKKIETYSEVNIFYKIKLRSYSITQLLFLTDLVKEIFEKSKKIYPSLQDGEMFVKTYHTTTSFIVNEHEYGNYLDLHYKFAEISKQNSQGFLHTVQAMENRADFNHFDHELASTYGSRQIRIPILNNKLEIGGRENFYILVTFGPRTLQIAIQVKFYKNQ
jgi:thiamine phosphate synthase YjbQ (UPF0047 family)